MFFKTEDAMKTSKAIRVSSSNYAIINNTALTQIQSGATVPLNHCPLQIRLVAMGREVSCDIELSVRKSRQSHFCLARLYSHIYTRILKNC
jgi:hypothetical protein